MTHTTRCTYWCSVDLAIPRPLGPMPTECACEPSVILRKPTGIVAHPPVVATDDASPLQNA